MLNQIVETIHLWRFVLYSAVLKVRLRNSGSNLGILWEPLGTFLVSIVLAVVWSKILAIESVFDYFLYVYSGMLIWALISNSVSNLCATLIKNSAKLSTKKLGFFVYIAEDLVVSFIPFFLSLPFLIIAVSIFSPNGYTVFSIFFIFFAIIVNALAALFFGLSVGVLAFFFGDVRQVVASIMRLGFLVTPIIWMKDSLGGKENLLFFNPFYGFLDVSRSSLTGLRVELSSLFHSLAVMGVLFVLSVLVAAKFNDKIKQRALSL